MLPLRTLIVIALISVATIEIWIIYRPRPRMHAADLSNLTSATEGEVDYATIRSIGMFAAYFIREKNIKKPLSQKDMAQLIVSNQSTNKSVPGIFYEVDDNGLLVDLNSKKKYKVYSDGTQVTVAPQPEGTAIHQLIYPAQGSE